MTRLNEKVRWALLGLGTLGLVFTGCASSQVRLDEASAQRHRAEAAKERSKAEVERSQFDPHATVATSTIVSHGPDAPTIATQGNYNPTKWHLDEAARHSKHAHEHEAAAQQLEGFEASECQAFNATVRTACPVLAPVVAVEDIDRGVRIQFRAAVEVAPIAAHMRCHLAYARARGFEGVPDRPLYIRGAEIRASADGQSVEILGASRSITKEIQRRSREVINVH